MEKLIQIRIEDDVKQRVDSVFRNEGLSSQQAVKMFLTQVANTGHSPFEGMFGPRNK
ncbi:type II toxin-antitoxin system RelB/DinJ family antitoxin [Weissella oryzae]|nr:type II toxin-antitoxin system RelB/DinJ family antitoxin [Weissella oryzae]